MTTRSAPRVRDPEIQRAFDQLYRDLNEVIELLNRSQTGTPKNTQSPEGTVRIVKVDPGDIRIAVKTDDGWRHSDSLQLQTKQE